MIFLLPTTGLASTMVLSQTSTALIMTLAPAECASPIPLIGQARLMTAAFRGTDLRPIAQQLIERATRSDQDANALMDLSTVLLLGGHVELGLAAQAQALQISRFYALASARSASLRVLAIMVTGDFMANTPLAFLFEDSDIALEMVYLRPDETLPANLPDHDVVFVAVSQSDRTLGLLNSLDKSLSSWHRSVLNRPAFVTRTSRTEAYRWLAGIEGLAMPATVRITRLALRRRLSLEGLAALPFAMVLPLIIRPVDSHAGRGLAKICCLQELIVYLDDSDVEALFISPFVDYRSSDGLFRKTRIALVGGVPYVAHMAVSDHWMIHYLNAGMAESAEKRAEEQFFMQTFRDGFASRHRAALKAVAERFGLDYLVVDCAETATGELLVFEMDPAAVVHSMDPVELYPYKGPNMCRLYDAFRSVLLRRRFAGDSDPGESGHRALESVAEDRG